MCIGTLLEIPDSRERYFRICPTAIVKISGFHRGFVDLEDGSVG